MNQLHSFRFIAASLFVIGALFFSTMKSIQAQGTVATKTPWIKIDHSDREWYKKTQDETPNFQEVKKAYDAYFLDHPLEKSPQRNLVRRWISMYAHYQDKNGFVHIDQPTAEDYQKINKAEKQYLRFIKSEKPRQNLRAASNPPNATWNDSVGTWRMIGPYHSTYVPGIFSMFGGFNDRVYINPYNSKNMFAGQSYGGLWVSKDAGATWKLTDSEFPNGKNGYANRDMYYGEIEAHPTDANRIMAGTEAGLLISNNGGESWMLDATMNLENMPGARSYFVASQPDDPNVMLVSYGKRIYRTTDGGINWNMVFDNSGVGPVLSNGQHNTIGVYQRWYNFFGLEFHPTDENVVYLGALNGAREAIIFKSEDFGATFSQLVNTGIKDWMKMMTSPADDEHVFLANMFINANNPNADEGIYKYDTTGVLDAFIPMPSTGSGNLLDDIIVSPTNMDEWFFGGYASGQIWKSTNGGQSWATNNPGYVNHGPGKYVHSDVRSLSAVKDTLLVGTDGGLHISFDGGVTFASAGDWISGIDQWGFSSAYKGEILASGDDHGPTEIRTKDADRSWRGIGGADSGEVQINKCNTDYMYGRDVYTRFLAKRTSDSTYSRMANQLVNAKFKYLAQDPDEYFTFYPIAGTELSISKDNMNSKTLLKTFNSELTKVEVTLKNNQILFVLENNLVVHKSVDGGNTFTEITPSSATTNGRTNISDIEIDETGENVWLSYGQTQTQCKAVHSADGGATWTNITTNVLPSFVASHITYQRGTNGRIYLGTNGGGVWTQELGDSDWSILGAGLPSMGYITTMYTVPDLNKFRMGSTRGAFEHALVSPSELLAHFSAPFKTTTTCPTDTTHFYDYSSYFDNGNITFDWTFEGGTPATSTEMNPKVVYEESGIFDVSLTIEDGQGGTSTYTREDFMRVGKSDCNISTLPGQAVRNTNNNNYVLAPSMDVQATQNYTMMAWVKGEGVQRAYAGILTLRTSTGSVHLNLRDASTSGAQIGYHHPNGQWWWSSGLFLQEGEWTHLAMVVEPTGITIYKNGNGVKHNRTVVVADLQEKFGMGTMFGREGDRCYKGLMDEVAFYKRALTETEIKEMMHLTKENPNYPIQADEDLIAYYQFNESGGVVYDHSGGGKNATLVGSAISREVSDGPFGGGVSQMENVTTTGVVPFGDPGVTINFGGANTPNGPVVVSHIDNGPDIVPMDKKMHEEGYYIVDNYGTNETFDPLTTISFDKTGTISDQVVADGANFDIRSRPTNMHDEDWTSEIKNNFTLTAGNAGGVLANDASKITTLGQYILVRDEYPLGEPRVRIQSADEPATSIIGGESVSLYLGGQNQGFLLPVLEDVDLAAAGAPTEGMMAYAKSIKGIIVFQNNAWQEVVSEVILDELSGLTNGSSGVSFGDNSSRDSSAVFQIDAKGFIKYTDFTHAALTGIKYPEKGMIIYRSDAQTIAGHDGSNWAPLKTQVTDIPVSTNPPLDVEGMGVEPPILPNAALQDNASNGGVMIPRVEASNIKNPKEGLFIFDPVRDRFMFYNGSLWEEVMK